MNVLAELATLLMMIEICADVLARNLFHFILEGGAETTTYYFMVALAYFPLAQITRDDGHLQASFFTSGFSPRGKAILEGVVALIMCGFMGLIAWQTTLAAIDKMQFGEMVQAASINLPIWPSRWILPLGAGVMSLYALWVGLAKLTGARGAAEAKIEEF
jgi:TRAP-type C4-dicarboxylate transport system permease small subunit